MHDSEVDHRLARCRERLANAAPMNLPLDHPRPARQRFLSSMVPITIDPATGDRLRRIAAEQDATLFQLLAAVYAYWLRSYTEQDDVVFATAHDFRQDPELESMAGCRLTPVVLRISVAERSTCIGLLTRMRTEVLDAIECAVPFERLVPTIDLPHDQRRNPSFQTALVLEPAMLEPDPTWSIDQMETAVGALVGQSKLDISVGLAERSDGRICGRLIYNADRFDTYTAQLMQSHFVRLLRNVATAPDLPLAELSGPDERDRRRQLNEFNPKPLPAATAAQDRCIHELIVDQATRTPDMVAVVVADQNLSYRDLLGRSQRIAARLTEAGAGPGVVVAICVDRSIQLVPALLGVLLSGGAYLPLDPNQPESRSLFMIADAGATVLLTDSIHRLQRAPSDIEVVDLSRDTQSSDAMVPAFIPGNCSPQDLAYVIYTSGSTGTPKGVQVEHRSVVNLMMAIPAALGLSDADTFLSVVSYTFDGSVGDIFTTLALGATLVLATDVQTKDPRELGELIECYQATAMSATPTAWSMHGFAGDGSAARAGEPLAGDRHGDGHGVCGDDRSELGRGHSDNRRPDSRSGRPHDWTVIGLVSDHGDWFHYHTRQVRRAARPLRRLGLHRCAAGRVAGEWLAGGDAAARVVRAGRGVPHHRDRVIPGGHRPTATRHRRQGARACAQRHRSDERVLGAPSQRGAGQQRP